jgi:hypothetical protein
MKQLIKSELIAPNSSFQKSHDTALAIAEYLGLDARDIRNKYNSSLYIYYSHNGVTYDLRISDHCANPLRNDVKKQLGYTPVELGNDIEIAKRTIDREIFGKKEVIAIGAAINHPNYGYGLVTAHNIDKDKLDVNFNGLQKSFFATVVIDRKWINL